MHRCQCHQKCFIETANLFKNALQQVQWGSSAWNFFSLTAMCQARIYSLFLFVSSKNQTPCTFFCKLIQGGQHSWKLLEPPGNGLHSWKNLLENQKNQKNSWKCSGFIFFHYTLVVLVVSQLLHALMFVNVVHLMPIYKLCGFINKSYFKSIYWYYFDTSHIGIRLEYFLLFIDQ